MKKILIWTKVFPVYSETFIRDHICGLIDSKYDITIYSQHIERDDVEALNGFQEYCLLEKTISLREIVPNNKLIRLLLAIKILCISICKGQSPKLCRALNILKYGKNALSLNMFYLCNYIISNNIDVIHAHYGTSANDAAIYKEIIQNIKLIATFHGFDIRLGYEKGGAIYDRLFKNADKIIAISKYNYDSLLELGASMEKIVLIPNGIYLTYLISIKRKIDIYGKRIKILSVGRLVKEKGYEYALRAFKKIVDINSEYELIYNIIGEGEERKNIERLVAKLGISNSVVLHGRKNTTEVYNEMQNSDIFLLSSIDEALPTVLIEAQAAALPVVATNVGSVEDMVENNLAGIVVPKMDEDQLASGLKYLIDNRDKWIEMGNYGRKRIVNIFGIENFINKLITIYEE